jgi:hypothetical protein
MLKYSGLLLFMVFSVSGFAQVKMQKQNEGFLFTENGKDVLFYQKEQKAIEGNYERCNYIHPLWGIDGEILTEDFPEDHLHQRGVYWAWHQIWIGDKRIGDGWEIKDFEQEITDVEYISKEDGSAILKTEVDWKSDLWKKEGKKVPYLREKTTIFIHPKTENFRIIDFEISLLALAENLSIGGSEDVKGYSGFSVRMKLPEDIKFIGPDGIIEPQNEAVQSKGYVNISGSVGKNNSGGGIVMVDNPQNPGYPQSWILRKQKSMQNAVYPGNKTVHISTHEPLIFRYSLIIYSGSLSEKMIKKITKKF